MSIIIKHQAIKMNWVTPFEIESPKTLILGSFNPFNNIESTVDYYYGRKSNHFWKVISEIIGEDENYFYCSINGFKRKLDIMKNNFCFYDVIDSIDFNSQNSNILNDYIENEVLSNFLDQKIWISKTKYKEQEITLDRNYNYKVIDFIEKSSSIRKVIHTMGENRITEKSSFPKEKKLKDYGFDGYINKIKKICLDKNIEFIYKSLSPSDYAVKTNKVSRVDLRLWLEENIFYKKQQ